jgi:arylsulfatase A-like enzyme
VALGAALAACGREAPRYHVSARLVERLPPSLQGWVSGDCPIGDQHRPTLGCTAWRGRGAFVVPPTGGHPAVAFPASQAERGKPIPLKIYWRGAEPKAELHRLWAPGATITLGPRASVVVPDFPPAEAEPGSVLLVWSRLPPLDAYETTPVKVAKGAVLSVGIGIDPDSPPAGVEAVEFSITADPGTGPRELLRAVLRPGSPESARWQDHAIPLDAVQGEATRFRFVTHVQVTQGPERHRAVVVPLWGAPEVLTPAPDDERPNVILVSLDTLRGDHVGALGCKLPITPRIDALARDGVVFETASTTFPSTTGGHLSMLTGQYPIRLGISDPSRRVRPSARLLAEAMGEAGWRTAAVTENVMISIPVGFARGVSHYQENLETELEPPSYKAAHTTDAAIAWIEQNRHDRFFLFVHTYAVHFPYFAPEAYQLTTWHDGVTERPIAEASDNEKLHLHYAADVRFADEQVGRLVDTLERLGLARRTIVIVTSDHGEAFFEHHGRWGHGMLIHDEIMHVPVVMWGPGRIPAGRRIRTPVSLVDLPPTILELAGVPPLTDIDGESQVARMRGGPEDLDRIVYAFGPAIPRFHEDQIAARTTTMKWILTASTPPRLVAYDLVADPGEQHPLEDPALLARGREALARYQALGEKAAPPVEIPISEKTRQQMRALGYAD